MQVRLVFHPIICSLWSHTLLATNILVPVVIL